jgi:hypothetical protein
MSSLLKTFLNGFTNMNSVKSERKDNKMINFKTNVPEIDQENSNLLIAASILEKCGNSPGITNSEFLMALLAEDIDIADEQYSTLTTAAIAIETMMSFDQTYDEGTQEPTVH